MKRLYFLAFFILTILISPFAISVIQSSWITNETSSEIDNSIPLISFKNLEKKENKTLNLSNLKTEISNFEKSYLLNSFLNEKLIDNKTYLFAKENYKEFYPMLISYDYINKTNLAGKYIKEKENFLNIDLNKLNKDEINSRIKELGEKNDILLKNIKKDYNFFPNYFTEDIYFNFMLKWMWNNKILINKIKETSKTLNIDYKIVISCILTEQTRYSMTQRWFIKQYLKRTPFLFSMTSMSYGVWWIKSFTAEKIIKDAKKYGYLEESLKKHEKTKWESFWKNILTNSKYEWVYPSYLVKNVITRWGKEGIDIKSNYWVIRTLYNFWNIETKKPHSSPKAGGADIVIKQNTFNFWWLGESFYWYQRIYNPY